MLGWNTLIRWPPGTRLNVCVMLPRPLREAIAAASERAAVWLDGIDGAIVEIVAVSAGSCRLRCHTAVGEGELSAAPTDRGTYTLAGRVQLGNVARVLDFSDVVIQSGGRTDAYVADASRSHRPQLVRLRHANEGTATLSIFAASFASRLPASFAGLVPSRIDIARLSPVNEAAEWMSAASVDWDAAPVR